ncbi:hypothetical protein EYF80_057421 [Liparis tanakae]|uniref:Secreted protein n=1 Tax=Liparis tanakae TaxID=230148 RepID=A0A4Z2EV51_9TELE|nr:hypothetical protein EYF80_057421 [Liparis tanakae]
MHSELLLVHSLQVALMAHGVRHCLALAVKSPTAAFINTPPESSWHANFLEPQKPASLGSPGSHCRLVLVKGDMSSQHQYDTLIFRRPTHGVTLDLYCERTTGGRSHNTDTLVTSQHRHAQRRTPWKFYSHSSSRAESAQTDGR